MDAQHREVERRPEDEDNAAKAGRAVLPVTLGGQIVCYIAIKQDPVATSSGEGVAAENGRAATPVPSSEVTRPDGARR